jgi:hypothetical protein
VEHDREHEHRDGGEHQNRAETAQVRGMPRLLDSRALLTLLGSRPLAGGSRAGFRARS